MTDDARMREAAEASHKRLPRASNTSPPYKHIRGARDEDEARHMLREGRQYAGSERTIAAKYKHRNGTVYYYTDAADWRNV